MRTKNMAVEGGLQQGESPQELFEAFLERTLEPIPAEMTEQRKTIDDGFRRKFDNPPFEGCELALRRRLVPDQVRQMMFYPTTEDIQAYPTLISSPAASCPPKHPLYATQGSFITVLYMHHSRMPVFDHEFIRKGGLRSLAVLMGTPESHPASEHIRGQAIDIFFRLTDENVVDWFSVPKDNERHPEEDLREKMFELTKSPLLKNLAINYDHPLSGQCLQIIAFFASWVRLLYCPNNQLRLTGALLGLLEKWGQRTDVPPADAELARKVHEDFSRFGTAEEAATQAAAPKDGADVLRLEYHEDDNGEGQGGGGGGEGSGGSNGSAPPGEGEAVLTDGAKGWELKYGSGVGDPEADKQQGNAAFKRGEWDAAISAYSTALDRLVPQEALIQAMPQRAVYHTNRAAAYLSRGGEGDATRAQMDCEEAVQYNPKYAKAHFRSAQALEQLGRIREAARAAERAQELAVGPSLAEMSALAKKLEKLAGGGEPEPAAKREAAQVQVVDLKGLGEDSDGGEHSPGGEGRSALLVPLSGGTTPQPKKRASGPLIQEL